MLLKTSQKARPFEARLSSQNVEPGSSSARTENWKLVLARLDKKVARNSTSWNWFESWCVFRRRRRQRIIIINRAFFRARAAARNSTTSKYHFCRRKGEHAFYEVLEKLSEKDEEETPPQWFISEIERLLSEPHEANIRFFAVLYLIDYWSMSYKNKPFIKDHIKEIFLANR